MYHKLKKILNSRSSLQRCSIEKAVLKSFAIYIAKGLCWSLRFLKKRLPQVFSSEYCSIFINTYFYENLRTTASIIPASYC